MDPKEFLIFIDDIVFSKTGKHLDNLQQAILLGTLQGKKYHQIAEDYQCSEGHIKDIASQLWSLLSEILGIDVKKTNFKATLERLELTNISHYFGKDNLYLGNISICRDNLESKSVPQNNLNNQNSSTAKSNQVYLDLTEAPISSSFYGRTEEFALLQNWLIQEKAQLICLSGLSGIGKTALSLKLVKKIQDEFDYVIWRSLVYTPCLSDLLQSISKSFNSEKIIKQDDCYSLLSYLQQYRCLLILDDFECLFSAGKLASEYLPNYGNYNSLFKLFTEIEHQSCLIVNTQEIPYLDEDNKRVKLLTLKGIDSQEIIDNNKLVNQQQWQLLIDIYQGHPFWLKMLKKLIIDLFNGQIEDYLQLPEIVLPNEILHLLNLQFQRLTEAERQIIFWLSTETELMSTKSLIAKEELSATEILNSLQSLLRRSLIEKQALPDGIFFTVIPIIREYFLVIKKSG